MCSVMLSTTNCQHSSDLKCDPFIEVIRKASKSVKLIAPAEA